MSSDQSRQANQVVIYNIHVLYNPKRGEIKLGQVRTLRDRAYAVSKVWNDAPVIICGDVNCTPKSPLYKFVSEYKISLSGLSSGSDMVSSQLQLLRYATGRESRVITALTLLKSHLFSYQGYVSAALVLGGVDVTGPHLHTVYPHGSTDTLPFATMGSGSPAAMAIFDAIGMSGGTA